MEEENQAFVYFTILEDLFTKERDYPRRMKKELWKNLPEELQHMVLLWLPAAAQARLSKVCRRWRWLMKSASFRERTAALAWNSGECKAVFTGKHYPNHRVTGDDGDVFNCMMHKVHKVSLNTFPRDLPHDVLAPVCYDRHFQWLAHGGVLAVAVVAESSVRVCVLDSANGSWQELPSLVLASPCAELRGLRSWEACLYDAVYDRKHKKWRYKVFVSWIRKLGVSDEELEEHENMRARTSFHGYSSTTNSWTVTATALQPLVVEAHLRDSAQREGVYLLEYCVGQGPSSLQIYAKQFIEVDHEDIDGETVDLLRLSSDGRVMSTLPKVPRLLPDRQRPNTWWILLDSEATPFCIFPDASIYRFTGLEWKIVTELSQEMLAKTGLDDEEVWPDENERLLGAYMVDPIIFLHVQGMDASRSNVSHHILAYHVVDKSWLWVGLHSYSSPWTEFPTQFLSTQ